MRIIHIITSLGDGGAENILYKICKYENTNEHIIISLKKPDKYSKLIKKKGIRVYHLNIKFYSIVKFLRLIKLLKTLKPKIVQTWLIHGDLIGGIAAKFSNIKNIFWNVRYSNLKFESGNIVNIFLIKILVLLSETIPSLIVVVSKSAKKNCKKLGYPKKKLILISNGYELSILKSSLKKKKLFRKSININKNITVIGNVARYAKMKDHLTLLKALSLVKLKKVNFLCVMVGTQINRNNLELIHNIKNYKLTKNIKLLGRRDDIVEIMSGIDIYVQSSKYGEGFPNVVAEAMACKTPCVVTNSGDAPFIVGRTGWIVPTNNPKKLASSILNAISEKKSNKWLNKRVESRIRIKKNFHINKMIVKYRKLWSSVNI